MRLISTAKKSLPLWLFSCHISFSSPVEQCQTVLDAVAERVVGCNLSAEVPDICNQVDYINGDVDGCLRFIETATCSDVAREFNSHCNIFYASPF